MVTLFTTASPGRWGLAPHKLLPVPLPWMWRSVPPTPPRHVSPRGLPPTCPTWSAAHAGLATVSAGKGRRVLWRSLLGANGKREALVQSEPPIQATPLALRLFRLREHTQRFWEGSRACVSVPLAMTPALSSIGQPEVTERGL